MAANGLPVVLLTDLDNAPCPSGLIENWLGQAPHIDFLFRVCVREIEAWLIADANSLAHYLGVPPARIPREPDAIIDPKGMLLELAARSNRAKRASVLPRGSAPIGAGYNDFFCGFVTTQWNADRAANRSRSLARARARIDGLAARAARMLEGRAS
jgi:hypothetical protein